MCGRPDVHRPTSLRGRPNGGTWERSLQRSARNVAAVEVGGGGVWALIDRVFHRFRRGQLQPSKSVGEVCGPPTSAPMRPAPRGACCRCTRTTSAERRAPTPCPGGGMRVRRRILVLGNPILRLCRALRLAVAFSPGLPHVIEIKRSYKHVAWVGCRPGSSPARGATGVAREPHFPSPQVADQDLRRRGVQHEYRVPARAGREVADQDLRRRGVQRGSPVEVGC